MADLQIICEDCGFVDLCVIPVLDTGICIKDLQILKIAIQIHFQYSGKQ